MSPCGPTWREAQALIKAWRRHFNAVWNTNRQRMRRGSDLKVALDSKVVVKLFDASLRELGVAPQPCRLANLGLSGHLSCFDVAISGLLF